MFSIFANYQRHSFLTLSEKRVTYGKFILAWLKLSFVVD